ncbi:MAG: hypothetical protein GXP08_11155 [Gammaproteobacteria bacterium]|nr:hypothetical protein [Gammaproteobacteria bacterium]
MHTLKINLPDINMVDITSLSPRPNALKPWLDTLPLGDLESSAQAVITVLQCYNRCRFSVDTRLQAMDSLSHIVQELTKALVSKYRESAFPLTDRNRARSSLVNQLLGEMAFGFKHIINDYYQQLDGQRSNQGQRQNKWPSAVFFNAIRIAIVYLSRQLITAYSIYTFEPQGVWLDLHQLYKLAESFNVNEYSLECRGEPSEKYQANFKIIQHAYVRIVLLSMTNPYHLMQGEAQLIYNYLNKWCIDCRIATVTGYRGNLVIDFDRDLAPYFILSQDIDEPENYCTIDMERLLERFNATVDVLASDKAAIGVEYSKRMFTERVRRDRLLRLQKVWTSRLERQSVRIAKKVQRRVASGLSASHYFVDKERVFVPESDEAKMHLPLPKTPVNPETLVKSLSLMPSELEHWKHEKQPEKIALQQRMPTFDNRMDAWGRMSINKSYEAHVSDTCAVQYYTHNWQQTNASDTGIGLRCDPTGNARISMGSIIAYQGEQKSERWRLGMIRWVKEYASHLDMGVMLMPGIPRAVAIRAIVGAGCGSEYFRAILLTVNDHHCAKTTLIAPASMYDVDAELVMNDRHKLRYIKLTQLLEITTCYSLFEFQNINIPAVEQANIREFKAAEEQV